MNIRKPEWYTEKGAVKEMNIGKPTVIQAEEALERIHLDCHRLRYLIASGAVITLPSQINIKASDPIFRQALDLAMELAKNG